MAGATSQLATTWSPGVGVDPAGQAGASRPAREVDADVELDTAPREVEIPADLAEALAGDDAARTAFDGLSFTHRKEWVRWVEEAKKADTRATRLAKTVESLRAGHRAR
ncbi:MAG: YdeI/OmpD-associated family protein [Streptosporangiaceae bacterium]